MNSTAMTPTEYFNWSGPHGSAWKRSIIRYLNKIKTLGSIESVVKSAEAEHRESTPGRLVIDDIPVIVGTGTHLVSGYGDSAFVYEATIHRYAKEKKVCIKTISDRHYEVTINQEIAANPSKYPHLLEAILVTPATKTSVESFPIHYLVMERAICTLSDLDGSNYPSEHFTQSMKWKYVGDFIDSLIELAEMGYRNIDKSPRDMFLVKRPGIDRLVLVMGDFGHCVYIGDGEPKREVSRLLDFDLKTTKVAYLLSYVQYFFRIEFCLCLANLLYEKMGDVLEMKDKENIQAGYTCRFTHEMTLDELKQVSKVVHDSDF